MNRRLESCTPATRIFLSCLLLALAVLPTTAGALAYAAESEAAPGVEATPSRVKVPGALLLHSQHRREATEGSGVFEVAEEELQWNVAETAIVVCDMWDDHWCRAASQRVGVLAPRMNEVLTAARSLGVQIIHAPSETMDFYKNTPYRQRMQAAATAEPPEEIARWRRLDPSSEPALPIDDAAGGCDDAVPTESRQAWTRQHAAIDITGFDGVTDSGVEVYNFCRQEGIKNLVIMGVHTNMCVLGRSFGIRQMTRLGMNVVLARDLTDAMYDPRQAPFVSHKRGTELVVEHIEKQWCPSIASGDLTQVIPGSDDPIAQP